MYLFRNIRSLLLFSLLIILLSPKNIAFADLQQNTTVSLTIPSTARDYQFSFSSLDNSEVHQGATLSYQIVYGAKRTADPTTAVTIVADFSHDTYLGADILQYIPGSATYGYNDAPPVIDLVKKTITWTIPALPAGVTDQIVGFQLQVNSNYTGANAISFSLTASMTKEADQTIAQSYRYVAPTRMYFTPTPTRIPLSPTPTSKPLAIVFFPLSADAIISDTVKLGIQTSVPTRTQVYYGTSPNNVTQLVTNQQFAIGHIITISSLLPNTKYFFRIVAIDIQGNFKRSYIFSVTTAQPTAAISHVNPASLVLLSSDIAMYTPHPTKPGEQPTKPMIVIPQGNAYNFRFQLNNSQFVKKVLAVVRNSHVLGISTTDTTEPNTTTTELVETSPGIYEGRLKTPPENGDYLISVRIYDTKGNITEDPIASMHVGQGITIQEAGTGKPVEDAQVLLYYKNFRTGQFEILPPQLFPVKNPDYSDINGHISTPLPLGTYKVSVTAIGYEPKSVMFTLGSGNQTYPVVQLTKNPFNILTTMTYYWTAAADTVQTTKSYLQNTSNSSRFFALNALLATAMLVILTILSFAHRLRVPFHLLPHYFFQLRNTKKKKVFIYIEDSELVIVKVIGMAFEFLLILSFIFELSLGCALGFEKTVLFLIISIINLILWIIHLMQQQI